jgi:hypothetical protein
MGAINHNPGGKLVQKSHTPQQSFSFAPRGEKLGLADAINTLIFIEYYGRRPPPRGPSIDCWLW